MYFRRAILYNVAENLKFSSNLICFVIIQSFYNGLYYLYLNIIKWIEWRGLITTAGIVKIFYLPAEV